jgi:hypothetical protein
MGIKVVKSKKKKVVARSEKILNEVVEVPETFSELQEKAKEVGMADVDFLQKYSFEVAQPFNIVTKNKSFWTNMTEISFWRRKKIAGRQHTVNLIKMELNNGKHRTFLVNEQNRGFYYLDKRYVFDEKVKYEDIDLGFWCYDFHEDFSLPFRRRFPVSDVKSALEKGKVDGFEVAYATNPSVLERFINSTVLEMLLRGGNLQKLLMIIMIIVIITGVVVLVGFGVEGYFVYKINKIAVANHDMLIQIAQVLTKGK